MSQHKEEQAPMMPMALCSRIATCSVPVQPSWEGHGEAMQGFSSTTLISLMSLCLRVGMPGILLAKSEFLRASPSANLIWTVGLCGPHCTKHMSPTETNGPDCSARSTALHKIGAIITKNFVLFFQVPIDIRRGRLLRIGIQYFQASKLGKETKQGIREAID